MTQSNQCYLMLSQKNPWADNGNTIWLASTVRLARNIDRFKFPVKLDGERQRQIISAVSRDLINGHLLTKPQLLHAENISPIQKDFLVEHFLSLHGFHQAHSGEAFIIEETGQFLTTFNVQDHIHLHMLDAEGELEKAWNKLVAIETALGKTVSYAFSPKYGFLTSDFNQCGTALRASVFLQVPGLVHADKIDGVLEKLMDDSLVVTGIQGNPTEIIGDVLMIQNNYTLGLTEETIIGNLRGITTKLLLEENGIRKKIRQEDSAEIKDKVSRAFGVLIHSYQIEAIEALNAISLLKLGFDLGWVTGTGVKELNNLFFNCRRAHLLNQYKEKVKQEEIPHKRAEFIHRSLKEVKLVI
jgi:protein arginine kinase